jgi:hypothetical protein
VDVTFGSITLEVKSAAFVQSWQQALPSTISFPIEQRVATADVFCLLAEEDRDLLDPQDMSQWRFWVGPSCVFSPGQSPISRRWRHSCG